MSRNIGPTVEILLQRVRQTGGLAVDEDFATQIFTIAQQFTNAVLRRVFTSETLTTSKEKLLYSISSDLTNAIDIVSITESTRELVKCNSIADFSAYEQNWFRNITATRFEAWHQLSRDFFILYPGKASASSVTVEFVRQIPVYSDYSTYYNTACELPDEDVEVALKIAETVLMLRPRNLSPIKETLTQLIKELGARNVDVKS